MWIPLAIIGAVIAHLLSNKRYRWIYIVIKTLPRDLRGLFYVIKGVFFVRRCIRQNLTVPKLFSEVVSKNPQKIAFHFEDEAWSYAKVDEFSNKIARYFLKRGYKKGDTVALFLENCIEYPCIWLGLLKIGVHTALINTNLVKEPLLHSITITKCTSVIFGSSLVHAIQDITPNFTSMKLYQLREKSDDKQILEGCTDLSMELDGVTGQAVESNQGDASYNDSAIYIFTSGTTGLPKAAVITHLRCILLSKAYEIIGVVSTKDTIYTPLPLYHTAGGLMGVGQALLAGITVAIRKKFSATQYFKDCEKYNATVSQYVGEICRYILATPPNDNIKHKVRTIIGNGLRPQIWKQFVQRFGIKRVFEVYGATESIANMANIDGKEGAIGFIPRYFRFLNPMTLIKCNEATGAPIRDDKGRCIECDVDEPGIFIGKINDRDNIFKYDGYTDRGSSENKILCDVFRKGDRYFNTGDILVFDELGYYYFKDRTGDTFRWKCENVSTSEVEAIISNTVQLSDVIVYGVKVPENEGNAGMAAIVDINNTLDINSIAATFMNHLPGYAVPIFIRVLKCIPLTGTFKLKKTELRDEGFNINTIKDRIYFLHPQERKYVQLTTDIYQEILMGKIRL